MHPGNLLKAFPFTLQSELFCQNGFEGRANDLLQFKMHPDSGQNKSSSKEERIHTTVGITPLTV